LPSFIIDCGAGLFDHTPEQTNISLISVFLLFFPLGYFFLSIHFWRISLESLVFGGREIFQSVWCFYLKVNLALRKSASMIKQRNSAVHV